MDILKSIGYYLAADIRLATPILFGALGLVFMNTSGLTNIGCEGIMLIAALLAVVGAWLTGSVWMGLLFALASGAIMGLLFAFLTVTLRANQIVVGTAFNLLGSGLSATLFRAIFGKNTGTTPTIAQFPALDIPGINKIPIIGDAFLGQLLPVYLAFLLVPLMTFFIYKTKAGLNLRSVGENAQAADTMGVNVYRVRYMASIIGCAISALGGAFLSTGLLHFFTEEMVSGRGFIALAAVYLGRYTPVGAMLAAMLFAAGNVLANSLPALNSNIPHDFILMIPYVMTILALSGLTGHVEGPSEAGKPYKKG